MIRRCGPAERCTSLDFEFWSLLLFSVCSTSRSLLETEPSAAAPTTSYLLPIIMNSDPLKLQAPINSPASHFGHSRRKAASISEIPFCTFKTFTPWDEPHRPWACRVTHTIRGHPQGTHLQDAHAPRPCAAAWRSACPHSWIFLLQPHFSQMFQFLKKKNTVCLNAWLTQRSKRNIWKADWNVL